MLRCLQSKKNSCRLFERRLFKIKKNGAFLCGISSFVLETYAFLYYVHEKSDDVINSSTIATAKMYNACQVIIQGKLELPRMTYPKFKLRIKQNACDDTFLGSQSNIKGAHEGNAVLIVQFCKNHES